MLFVVWSLLNLMFKRWCVQKCTCRRGTCFSATEEKGFLVTFHLELGAVSRQYKDNLVVLFIGIVKKAREFRRDLKSWAE